MSRIAVFAYSDTGHACLKRLFERGSEVVLVATHADTPGETLWFPSVAELARSRGVEPLLSDDPKALLALLTAAAPDFLLSIYYRNVLPDELLSVPRLGAYNIHGSLLPKYRGRAPVNWAVANGEIRTGATLHRMISRPDAGAIVDQEEVEIGEDDTARDVQERVTAAAVKLLDRSLGPLEAGTAKARPQEESAATTFGRRRPEDGRIDWARSAREVHNLVRAVSHPYPGAFTDLFGRKTTIWKTRLPGLAEHDTYPGEVRYQEGKLYVACGDDHYVEVLRLQSENEEETDGARFAQMRAQA